MYNLAIVEDNIDFYKQLMQYFEQYQAEKSLKFNITYFENSSSFLKESMTKYDAIFLDIMLPDGNGMDIAKKIRETNADVILVFVTNMTQFAIKGYEVNALDYILKPITYSLFSLTLNKVIHHLKHKVEKTVTLQLKNGMVRIPISSIYYIEVMKHNVIFHTKQGQFTMRDSMKRMEETFKDSSFAKCNSCYLVNLKNVTAISKDSATVGGTVLTISRRSYHPFLQALTDYVGKEII